MTRPLLNAAALLAWAGIVALAGYAWLAPDRCVVDDWSGPYACEGGG